MEKILSILLTVYNQKELVHQFLDHLIQYQDDNIDIIVQDDCSTDDIYSLVAGYNDSRITYYKNERNLGHDRNIIKGIEHCKTPYVFLFRTRDLIIPNQISNVIETIIQHPSSSFFLFSTTNEPHYNHMALEKRTFSEGEETIRATYELMIHPSGQLYRVESLRLDEYSKYIDKYFADSNAAFNVHELIRMDLAISGDFYTSDLIAWRWAKSIDAHDKATNSMTNGLSPYDPSLQYPRYFCELDFAYYCIPMPHNVLLCEQIMHSFIWRLTYLFADKNNSGEEFQHYGTRQIDFSVSQERKHFVKKTIQFIQQLPIEGQQMLMTILREAVLKNIIFGVKRLVRKLYKRKTDVS